MEIRVAGSAGKQVAANKVNLRDGERQFRQLDDLRGGVQVSPGATFPGSSYRQMGMEGPIIRGHTLVCKRPVEAFSEAGEPLSAHSSPIDPGRAAHRKGSRAGKPEPERTRRFELLRRGDEPGQPRHRHAAHEAQGYVKTARRNPAYIRQRLAQESQRPPQPLTERIRRPDGVEQAQPLQATGTAAGRSTASTPRTAASTSPREEAHPSEKRTAPSSEVPRMR